MKQSRYDEMRASWMEFHKKNPQIWEQFKRFTFELIGRGFKHGAAKSVMERVRWETETVDERGKSTWKTNNNHTAFYSRAFMLTYKEHAGFFRLRHQISQEREATHLPELGPKDFPYVGYPEQRY